VLIDSDADVVIDVLPDALPASKPWPGALYAAVRLKADTTVRSMQTGLRDAGHRWCALDGREYFVSGQGR
jgi:hypothetical protein